MPDDELLESAIVLDAPHSRTPLALREERGLYLTLIKVPVEATRIVDAIALVTETSDFLHAHIIAEPY